MKLHPVDRVFPVPQPHDLLFRRLGRDLQHLRHRVPRHDERVSGVGGVTEEQIDLCVAALYENAVDVRLAGLRGDSDFDRAERELRMTFEEWSRRRGRG